MNDRRRSSSLDASGLSMPPQNFIIPTVKIGRAHV